MCIRKVHQKTMSKGQTGGGNFEVATEVVVREGAEEEEGEEGGEEDTTGGAQ